MDLDDEKEVTGQKKKGAASRSDLLIAAIVILFSSVPRFLFLERDIFPNGVDEGIQILAGRMWAEGYTLYDQINTVQPPIMLSIYGLLQGDPIIFRYMSAMSSLIVLGLVMFLAYRLGGRMTMVLAGAFLSMDLMFLHESRLASLDMFCLLAISLGVAFFMAYRRFGRWPLIFVSGALLGLACMVKLYAVVAAGMVFIILLFDLLSGITEFGERTLTRFLPEGRYPQRRIFHIIIYCAAGTLAALVILLIFGPGTVIEGVIVNQMGRPSDPIVNKALYLSVFLGANVVALPFFFLGLSRTYRTEAGVLLIISGGFFLFMLLQAKTWPHHFLYISPAMAISAAVGGSRVLRRAGGNRTAHARKAGFPAIILVVSMLIIGGFSVTVMARGDPIEYQVANMVRSLTDEGDFVLSGNPRIAVLADRPTPPSIVNVAVVQFPTLTDDMLNQTVKEYDVKVIVLSYHLEDLKGFCSFVEENYTLRATYHDHHLPFEQDERVYRVFVLRG